MSRNSQHKARGRGPGRPIKPGQRLPGAGRPKGSKSITSVVRGIFTAGKAPGEIALELKKLSKHTDPRVRLAAIREILDRCDGRAQENVNLSGELRTGPSEDAVRMARVLVPVLKRHAPGKVVDILHDLGIEVPR